MRLAAFILLFLAGCTQFAADGDIFSQDRMAHSTGIGSMYVTSTAQDANHNCDDAPSNCCASGYHMCTLNELLLGGRRLEYSGTGRDTTPTGANADVATTANAVGTNPGGDCGGWSDIGSWANYYRTYCQVTIMGSWSCNTAGGVCQNTYPTWCCSD